MNSGVGEKTITSCKDSKYTSCLNICSIEERLNCKYYQELHYEQTINDRKLGMREMGWCRK